MFERFTDRARRVVILAQQEARTLTHDHIGTEHILLGVLGEAEGLGARALASLGVSAQELRHQIIDAIGIGRRRPGEHVPFEQRAKKALELSLREALDLGHNYIGTEHILLGLIRDRDCGAARMLGRSGVDLKQVRVRVITMLSSPSEPAPTEPDEPADDRLSALRAENSRLTAEVDRLRRLLREHGIDPDRRAQ